MKDVEMYKIKIWDIETRQEIATISGRTGGVSSICFTPDGDKLISRGVREIVLWDMQSYQEIAVDLDRHVKSIDNALQRVKRKIEKYLETRK